MCLGEPQPSEQWIRLQLSPKPPNIQVGPVLVFTWKDTKVVQVLSTCDKDTTTTVK